MPIALLRMALAGWCAGAGVPQQSAPAQSALACAGVLPSQVRVHNCRLARNVADALLRSATLRDEFARIEELHGIVYVVTTMYPLVRRRDLQGMLVHEVRVVGPIRLLRVYMKEDYGDRGVTTVAHELQHAIEVLEHPDVTTTERLDKLFESIGDEVGYGIYETGVAIRQGRAVLRELKLSAAAQFAAARK